jgi:hypothetical protein
MSKTCIQCQKSFPATEEYFHKSKDGLHGRCKKCRAKHERDRRGRKVAKKLEGLERGAVDLFLASAKLGGANVPHSSELLEVVMEYFGGVRGFANAFMKQFYDSPAGGAFRTKQIETVVRLVSQNTAMGGAKKPLELWTEEELEGELRQRLIETAITLQALPLEKSNESYVAVRPAGGVGGTPDGPGRVEVEDGGGADRQPLPEQTEVRGPE